MIQVVTASPRVHTEPFAQKLAAAAKVPLTADPSCALCNRMGYQTLYEIKKPYQLSVRRKLMEVHLAFLENLKGKPAVLSFSVFAWMADWMRWSWPETSSEAWEETVALGKKIAAHYSAIHHLESGPLTPYDGYVWRDIPNSAQIDRLMRGLYQDYGLAAKVTFHKEPA